MFRARDFVVVVGWIMGIPVHPGINFGIVTTFDIYLKRIFDMGLTT